MTTHQDDELLSRYLDGELEPSTLVDLERRLANDGELRSRLDGLRRVDERLRAAAAQKGPVPVQVRSLLARPSNNVIPLSRGSSSRRAAAGLAIAASLIVASGLLLAPQWRQAQDGAAREELLASALEGTPSSAAQWTTLDDGSELRPILSFASTDGQWCREYRLRAGAEQWHGVACRGSQGWQTQVLVDTKPSARPADEYQPAGAGDIDAISGFINYNAADIPLDAEQEHRLIESDWR